MPHEHSDAPVRKRSVVSIAEPKGEEGTLPDLMDQVAVLYHEAGHEQVLLPGQPTWKYGVVHFALLAVLQAPPEIRARLIPSEIGA